MHERRKRYVFDTVALSNFKNSLKSSGSACSAIGHLSVNLHGAKPLQGRPSTPIGTVGCVGTAMQALHLHGLSIYFHHALNVPEAGSHGNLNASLYRTTVCIAPLLSEKCQPTAGCDIKTRPRNPDTFAPVT